MDRRTLVRVLGGSGSVLLLGACSNDPGEPGGTARAPRSGSAAPDALDPIAAQVAPDADRGLTVVNASFEQLTGNDQAFAFGLTTPDNEPVRGADVQVYVIDADGEWRGPHPAEFRDVTVVPLGLYLTRLDLPEPGPTSLVAVTADGAAGSTTVQVTRPQASAVPAPGQPAVVVPTPTSTDPQGMGRVCTLDPPCGMHDVSLDEALAAGRPVVLTFATPAYCMTAICGPSVEVVDEVRASGDWGDTAWIHVEIFSDAGQTLSAPVEQWGLLSEPWLFAIDADGTVRQRADGPLLVLDDHVRTIANDIV
jgi:hypothetical protein